MAEAKIKKGAKVTFKTPRGTTTGVGKVQDIVESARGLWFHVKSETTGAIVKLRQANLSLA